MRQLVQDFPKQLETALQIAAGIQLPEEMGNDIHQVLIVGLGGSAFGGEISRNLMLSYGKVPVSIHRNYGLPSHVNANTLCLLCSYSGNTEETLDAAALATQAGAKCVVISSGGKLEGFAAKHDIPFIKLPEGYPPRAAVGLSCVQQLEVLTQAGVYAGDYKNDVKESIELLKAFDEHDEVKSLANNLKGRLPVIYATDAADAIAIRLRQQINENGKQLCWHHIIPEMNHNELVGWHHPEGMMDQLHVLFLHTDQDHPRNQIRIELNDAIIQKHTPNTSHIRAKGTSHLAQLMYLLHYSDWLSIYLAEANDVEATPVKIIDYLKGELAKR